MTTIFEFDFRTIFETLKDRAALEMVQRVVQAEVTFHEARLSQLKEMSSAIDQRIEQLSKA